MEFHRVITWTLLNVLAFRYSQATSNIRGPLTFNFELILHRHSKFFNNRSNVIGSHWIKQFHKIFYQFSAYSSTGKFAIHQYFAEQLFFLFFCSFCIHLSRKLNTQNLSFKIEASFYAKTSARQTKNWKIKNSTDI